MTTGFPSLSLEVKVTGTKTVTDTVDLVEEAFSVSSVTAVEHSSPSHNWVVGLGIVPEEAVVIVLPSVVDGVSVDSRHFPSSQVWVVVIVIDEVDVNFVLSVVEGFSVVVEHSSP